MIPYLIAFVDWTWVAGLLSVSGVFAHAWMQNKAHERSEMRERTDLSKRVNELELDVSALETSVKDLLNVPGD